MLRDAALDDPKTHVDALLPARLLSMRASRRDAPSKSPSAFWRHHRPAAARERPGGAGRDAHAAGRQAGRDVGRTEALAVDGLLARIAHTRLQVLARADRAVAGGRVGHGTKALDPHA